jgi:hypothetical protein
VIRGSKRVTVRATKADKVYFHRLFVESMAATDTTHGEAVKYGIWTRAAGAGKMARESNKPRSCEVNLLYDDRFPQFNFSNESPDVTIRELGEEVKRNGMYRWKFQRYPGPDRVARDTRLAEAGLI